MTPLAAAQPESPDIVGTVKGADRTLEAAGDAALDASSSSPGMPVAFETIEAGPFSWFVHRAYSVVDNPDEWELLWSHHNGAAHGVAADLWRPLPPVDFSQEAMLVVFMGSSHCGGDWQQVVSVDVRPDPHVGNVTTVWMDTNRSFVLDAVLYSDFNPHHFVKVPRVPGVVAFASRHVAGDAVDAAVSGAPVGAVFTCKPTQSPLVYRALDPGTTAWIDTVPGPASTIPFLGSPLAEGV